MKRLTILGSTGSVGTSTLDLVAQDPRAFELVALTAGRNAKALAAQAQRLRPAMAVVADPAAYGELKAALSGSGIEVAAGPAAVTEAAGRPADITMAAIVGAAGLEPTLAAVANGQAVALANKECLVTAGPVFMAAVAASGATLLPVDSEHNAIFQVFDRARPELVEKIILTASGGPFRDWTLDQMRAASPAQAVRHPNWSMGAKISVDSATLMNKGLELIEAHYLFPLRPDQLDVVIHPQSVVHGLVQYVDGSMLAQLGTPDMKTPIAGALAWPSRMRVQMPRLDLAALGQLTFMPPDEMRFPLLALARNCLAEGGSAPTVLNAANEEAVAAFLGGKIGFLAIGDVVGAVLSRISRTQPGSLAEILALDMAAREIARHEIGLI